MVPHKSRKYRAILDLSFILKLIAGEIASVNDTTVATAPAEAMDQIGGALPRIIAAMAEAGEEEVIFYAKWDIKDGFWRMVCEEGAEYNFAYVLPQERGEEPMIVIPTSLQMGWVNSPPYFGAATETARDIADEYAQAPIGSLTPHKFLPLTQTSSVYNMLPRAVATGTEALLKYTWSAPWQMSMLMIS